MATTPFSIECKLYLPSGPGLAAEQIPFGVSSSFTAKALYELDLPAVGAEGATYDLDLGMMPDEGLKGAVVVYETAVGAEPIAVVVNGTGSLEVAQGGFIAFGSPTPVAGITSLSVMYTTAARVRIWLLG